MKLVTVIRTEHWVEDGALEVHGVPLEVLVQKFGAVVDAQELAPGAQAV
jgi:hypothetical protein